MSGFVHALALAEAEGITATALAPFAKGVSALLPDIIDTFAVRVDAGEHSGEDSTITSAAASMEHIVHVSQAHGSDGFSRIAEVLSRAAKP